MVACAPAPEPPKLILDHEGTVSVDYIGQVAMPYIHLDNGAQPHGLQCETRHPKVAEAIGGRLIVHGPGQTEVRCEWEGQHVTFPLEVHLATELAFVNAPAEVQVGQALQLKLEARRGDQRTALGKVLWDSSNRAILQVNNGRIVGHRPGMVYVTARARGATAQLELRVTGPPIFVR